MTETRVKAFAMVHQDRLPIPEVAELLGITPEQVVALVKLEGASRQRAGTFPLTSAIPDRGHTVTATKDAVCDQHGPYLSQQWTINNPPERMPVDQRSFWGQCPQCDRIQQPEVERRTAEIRNRKANQDALRKEALRASGVPERFLDCDVWHWQRGMDKQREVWDVVKSYCMRIEDVIQHGRCLVLFGQSGTGKTHLACGIIRHVCEKGGVGRYTTAGDAIGMIRSTYSKGADKTEEDAMAELCRVDVLVIDEVGRQSDSNHERETMFRVLNRRYSDLKPTVLVSNLDRVALFNFLGQAVCDRLMEAGGRFLNFDWASQRSRRPDSDTDKEQDR